MININTVYCLGNNCLYWFENTREKNKNVEYRAKHNYIFNSIIICLKKI